jgi:hypothetical protein
MIPAKERDEVAPNAEDRQNQPGKLDRASPASNHKKATQMVQNPRVDGHLLSPSAAFRHRGEWNVGQLSSPPYAATA